MGEPTEDWTISILLPEGQTLPPPADPSGEHHRGAVPDYPVIQRVDARDVEGQWSTTINTLMRLSSSVTDRSPGWVIDELEVGLTLSATGELLFIAEAGAEASIKVVLKRAPPPRN